MDVAVWITGVIWVSGISVWLKRENRAGSCGFSSNGLGDIWGFVQCGLVYKIVWYMVHSVSTMLLNDVFSFTNAYGVEEGYDVLSWKKVNTVDATK